VGEIIKCKFNLFNEGRKYTGHHRNYILESAVRTCYAPETREGIRLREKLGYLGHGRRQLARKLALAEVEPVKLPDGTMIIVENVPSNVTVFFEVGKDGTVEHHQEILESDPGRVVTGLNASRVGGFSWACGGADGGPLGTTTVTRFHGFDYVMNPGFSANRGYILEDADGKGRDMILESICKAGVDDKKAEQYLNSWVASVQFRAADLEKRLEEAAIYEDSLRQTTEQQAQEIETLKQAVSGHEGAAEARKRLILECASRNVVAIPGRVIEAMVSMADERDFFEIVSFFESASRCDINSLPLCQDRPKRYIQRAFQPEEIEYGSATAGCDFSDNGFFAK
jgi:hypothetical protein